MQIELLLLKVAEFNPMYTYINMCDFGKIYTVPIMTFWIYQETPGPDYPFTLWTATHGRPIYIYTPVHTLNILMCFATQSQTKDPFNPVGI